MPPKPWPRGYLGADLAASKAAGQAAGLFPEPPWEPAGTRYLFTAGQLLDRVIQLVTDGVLHSRAEATALLDAVLEFLAPAEAVEAVALEAATGGAAILLTPLTYRRPSVSIDYVAVQVHGKLGTREEVSHTLALVHSGTSPTPETMSGDDLQAIGTGVMNAWTTFFNDPAVHGHFSGALVYDRVVVAAKSVAGPAPRTGSRKGLVRNVGDSAEVAFGAGVTGTGNGQLDYPFQCALVLTLGTQKKGASYRGRLYLGGLNGFQLSADGQIFPDQVTGIAAAFGTNVIAGMSRTAWHVNVWSPKLAAGREVASVQCGRVVDTMRSRRKSLVEDRQLGWGTL